MEVVESNLGICSVITLGQHALLVQEGEAVKSAPYLKACVAAHHGAGSLRSLLQMAVVVIRKNYG